MEFVAIICRECKRLWKAYEVATMEHLRLNGEMKLVAGDLTRFMETSTKLEAAAITLAEARKDLLDHQAATGHL
jgi:hypothetical protein